MRRVFLFPVVVMAFVLTAVPMVRAADLDQARTLVQTVAKKGIEDVLTANIPQSEKIDRFRSLFQTYFDVPSIARFVLARHWRDAPPPARDQFTDLFREVNVYTWARRFKDYNGQDLVITGVSPDGDKGAFVDTTVQQDGGAQPLTVRWRLRDREEGWKVVDLEVEGVSMAITYRSEYNSLLSGQGVDLDKLNSLLERQIAQLQAQQGG